MVDIKNFDFDMSVMAATDLYLRGFCGDKIKAQTGISVQSLLKHLLGRGIKYTKDDIREYQAKYVKSRYTADDVEREYRRISMVYPNLDKASHNWRVECLGCAFGNYKLLFIDILGKERYDVLRNECWKQKQRASVKKKYGVENVFEDNAYRDLDSRQAAMSSFCGKKRISGFAKKNPMLDPAVREARRQTMLSRYGVEHPNQSPEIRARMMEKKRKTMLERYGVDNPMKVPGIAQKSVSKREETMREKYGAPNTVQIEEFRNKIFQHRAENGTLNSSKSEDVLYGMLQARFGEDDVLRNVIVDGRYTYHVDFYVRSLDLFIELSGDKCHNGRWFDPLSETDASIVEQWRVRMIETESHTGKKSRYRKYIKTWTETDPEKRRAARVAGLHYLVFWDTRNCRRDGVWVPRLCDACDWFEAGCPMPEDWRRENTY